MPELRDIAEAAQELSGLSRRVLDYSLEMKRMVDAAKQPSFRRKAGPGWRNTSTPASSSASAISRR